MDDPGSTPRPPAATAYLVVVGACLALGALSALESRHVSVTHGVPLQWPVVFGSTFPRWLLLAATLPFVFRLASTMPPVPVRARVVLVHAGLFLALSVAHAAVDAWSAGRASPMISLVFPWSARIIRSWYNTMPMMVSTYAAVIGTAWALSEMRERERRTLRASRLEAQLQTARLAALRAQVQPHFLYNTLTGIAALVAGAEPARAVAAIDQLSDLLHASLGDDGREVIPMTEEVALAERYLALQVMRFGERLRYDIDVTPEAGRSQVPVLLLQPIIENAVVHGLDRGAPAIRVSIRAVVRGDTLAITVENDGHDPEASVRTGGHGVGLAGTRARLATGYGDAAMLALEARPGGGAVVRIELPRSLPAPVPELAGIR